MNSKRLLFISLMLTIIIVISQIASVSSFGIFKKKDTSLSPVQVNVAIGNTPSYPITFLQIPAGLGFPTAPYCPTAGQNTGQWWTASLWGDAEGAGDIPGDPGNPIVIGVTTQTPGANIVGGITSPPSSVIGTSMNLIYGTCAKLSCASVGGCPDPLTQAYILCYGIMPYFAPPSTSTNANDRWAMTMQVKGQSGWSVLAQSGQTGATGLPLDYVDICLLTAPGISGSLSWPGVNLAASNILSAQQITETNLGNQAPTSAVLTASDLTGAAPFTTSTLSAPAFSVGVAGSNVCDTSPAGGGTALTVGPTNLPPSTLYNYLGTGNEQKILDFCIGRDNSPVSSYIGGTNPIASSFSGTFDLTIS